MGLRQEFRFSYSSSEEVFTFLENLSSAAVLNRNSDFFVFSSFAGQPEFTFDCELTPSGIASDRAGNYFHFLGWFVEAVTGQFGKVEVQDL